MFKKLLLRIINYCIYKYRLDDDISDGSHTFHELYEFRKLYNAALFNVLYRNYKFPIYKSQLHPDGKPCFDGDWFVVVCELPNGQISNHYRLRDWNLFDIPVGKLGEMTYDGHTAKDVRDRLEEFIIESNNLFRNMDEGDNNGN